MKHFIGNLLYLWKPSQGSFSFSSRVHSQCSPTDVWSPRHDATNAWLTCSICPPACRRTDSPGTFPVVRTHTLAVQWQLTSGSSAPQLRQHGGILAGKEPGYAQFIERALIHTSDVYSSTCHGRSLEWTATCFGRPLLQCTNYFAVLMSLYQTATCLTRPTDSQMLDPVPARADSNHELSKFWRMFDEDLYLSWSFIHLFW